MNSIGSTFGLLSPIYPFPTGFIVKKLICMRQNDTVKYLNPDYETCFLLFEGVPSHSEKSKLNIFHHPVIGTSITQ
ncbi:MAG: hypothetical protein BWX51_00343 [Bacteroidetes bacterium ADurb.Bin012]|jgi:hypothetical protein|nr:MAG: hypothetical protein BWX51_00343 [Bacteroidetes bacterium ADurb.Bin012]